MNGTESSREARVARLRQARQEDSTAKTARATAAIRHLLEAGQRVSFARVAREANVSTWFVYNNPAVKSATQDAMLVQTDQGMAAAAVAPRERATPASLHTDLALARAEIKDLKRERDTLTRRVQLALGAEIDNAARADLVDRIHDLERRNQTLTRELSESNSRAEKLARGLEESEETVASLRLALRKAIRVVPRS
ncbi:DUF6262 family protein [Streptomyces sp. NPDC048211]|uniref:DUF6262 family protein n=1 Tax=Streptomyces sp. NPDC048211 TaxID=3365516 RepID=UPI0037234EFE